MFYKKWNLYCIFLLIMNFSSIVFAQRSLEFREALEKDDLEIDLEFFPGNLQYGDCLYLGLQIVNHSEKEVRLSRKGEVFQLEKCVFRSKEISEVFEYIPPRFPTIYCLNENVLSKHALNSAYRFRLEPFEIGMHGLTIVELPFLQDWDHPFWKVVRSSLNEQPRKIQISAVWTSESGTRHPFEFEVEIHPCSAQHMGLLECWAEEVLWLRNVDENIQNEYFRRRLNLGSEAGGIQIPYEFIQAGLSKPPVEALPHTSEMWRNLEKMLDEGTLRDEIAFTALFLELLDQTPLPDGTGRFTPEMEAFWGPMKTYLDTLPKVQRCAMLKHSLQMYYLRTPKAYLMDRYWGYPYLDKEKEERGQCEKRECFLRIAQQFHVYFITSDPYRKRY